MLQAFAITSIVFGCLVSSTCAQCYLEDASSTCGVCWQNGNPGTGRECPPGIDVSLKLTTQPMYDKEPYPTDYVIKIDRAKFPVVFNKGNHVVHANIHSCVTKFGACTPFVSSAPGLSTHTAALKGNFSAGNSTSNFPATSSNVTIGTYDLEATFNSMVQLTIDDYTVIAHYRFYTKDPVSGVQTKWDVAIGAFRNVGEAPVSISTDSIIGVATVGLLLSLFVGACLWGVRKGKLDLEEIIITVTGPQVSLIADLILAVLDAVAITACVIEEVMPINSLQHLVPICILMLVVVWAGSFFALFASFIQAKYMLKERFHKAEFTKDQLGVASSADLEAMSDRRKDSLFALAERRSKLIRAKWKFTSNLITVFLEDFPIACLNTYLLFQFEEAGKFVTASLILSCLLVGNKTTSIIAEAVPKKEILAATEALAAEAEKRKTMAPLGGVADQVDTTDEVAPMGKEEGTPAEIEYTTV